MGISFISMVIALTVGIGHLISPYGSQKRYVYQVLCMFACLNVVVVESFWVVPPRMSILVLFGLNAILNAVMVWIQSGTYEAPATRLDEWRKKVKGDDDGKE